MSIEIPNNTLGYNGNFVYNGIVYSTGGNAGFVTDGLIKSNGGEIKFVSTDTNKEERCLSKTLLIHVMEENQTLEDLKKGIPFVPEFNIIYFFKDNSYSPKVNLFEDDAIEGLPTRYQVYNKYILVGIKEVEGETQYVFDLIGNDTTSEIIEDSKDAFSSGGAYLLKKDIMDISVGTIVPGEKKIDASTGKDGQIWIETSVAENRTTVVGVDFNIAQASKDAKDPSEEAKSFVRGTGLATGDQVLNAINSIRFVSDSREPGIAEITRGDYDGVYKISSSVWNAKFENTGVIKLSDSKIGKHQKKNSDGTYEDGSVTGENLGTESSVAATPLAIFDAKKEAIGSLFGDISASTSSSTAHDDSVYLELTKTEGNTSSGVSKTASFTLTYKNTTSSKEDLKVNNKTYKRTTISGNGFISSTDINAISKELYEQIESLNSYTDTELSGVKGRLDNIEEEIGTGSESGNSITRRISYIENNSIFDVKTDTKADKGVAVALSTIPNAEKTTKQKKADISISVTKASLDDNSKFTKDNKTNVTTGEDVQSAIDKSSDTLNTTITNTKDTLVSQIKKYLVKSSTYELHDSTAYDLADSSKSSMNYYVYTSSAGDYTLPSDATDKKQYQNVLSASDTLKYSYNKSIRIEAGEQKQSLVATVYVDGVSCGTSTITFDTTKATEENEFTCPSIVTTNITSDKVESISFKITDGSTIKCYNNSDISAWMGKEYNSIEISNSDGNDIFEVAIKLKSSEVENKNAACNVKLTVEVSNVTDSLTKSWFVYQKTKDTIASGTVTYTLEQKNRIYVSAVPFMTSSSFNIDEDTVPFLKASASKNLTRGIFTIPTTYASGNNVTSYNFNDSTIQSISPTFKSGFRPVYHLPTTAKFYDINGSEKTGVTIDVKRKDNDGNYLYVPLDNTELKENLWKEDKRYSMGDSEDFYNVVGLYKTTLETNGLVVQAGKLGNSDTVSFIGITKPSSFDKDGYKMYNRWFKKSGGTLNTFTISFKINGLNETSTTRTNLDGLGIEIFAKSVKTTSVFETYSSSKLWKVSASSIEVDVDETTRFKDSLPTLRKKSTGMANSINLASGTVTIKCELPTLLGCQGDIGNGLMFTIVMKNSCSYTIGAITVS